MQIKYDNKMSLKFDYSQDVSPTTYVSNSMLHYIKKYPDLFSSFYLINNPNYSLDFIIGLREFATKIVDDFPFTFYILTSLCKIGLLDIYNYLISIDKFFKERSIKMFDHDLARNTLPHAG